MSESWGKEVNP